MLKASVIGLGTMGSTLARLLRTDLPERRSPFMQLVS
jgi:predicted dinucleotide-binding enzyme